MSTTLVTGATGNLGSNLCRELLRRGEDVAVFVKAGETLGDLADVRRELDVRFGDVRNLDAVRNAMRGIRRVYHLAGVAVPLNRLEREMWEVNVVGIYNVGAAALETGVERLVHTSSVAAIGFPPKGIVADEYFQWHDSVIQSSYMITKRRGEEVILGFVAAGLDVVVVNPAPVIAPGGDRRVGWPATIEEARRNRLLAYPGGGSAFCGVGDLVDGHVRAMERGRTAERYILSSANLTYRELGETIASVVGVRAPVVRCPDALLHAVGRVNAMFGSWRRSLSSFSLLVPENTQFMVRELYFDQSKAVRELGLSQSPISEAITQVNEWCVRMDRSEQAFDGTSDKVCPASVAARERVAS